MTALLPAIVAIVAECRRGRLDRAGRFKGDTSLTNWL